ncbi:MAG: superoxide dismutase [Gammaproteobacteria bacterium]|nr:superoxide dismutase [Gammaproteobacteria bacterium]
MPYELPPLPYGYDALEPWVSEQTLRLHHDVLQRKYVDTLNKLVSEDVPLETLIEQVPDGPILHNASQIWNHTFLWNSMAPASRSVVGSPLGDAIRSWDGDFFERFVDAAVKLFGSGYVWLLASEDGELGIWSAPNASNPLRCTPGLRPLLCLDVWEHAYLLDHGADRRTYAEYFLRHVANWEFASANYSKV